MIYIDKHIHTFYRRLSSNGDYRDLFLRETPEREKECSGGGGRGEEEVTFVSYTDNVWMKDK